MRNQLFNFNARKRNDLHTHTGNSGETLKNKILLLTNTNPEAEAGIFADSHYQEILLVFQFYGFKYRLKKSKLLLFWFQSL